MGSSISPVHGRLINLYALRPNGFKGSKLNDLTWGAFSPVSDSAHFEVVIDGIGTGIGGVDEFKWRENGGAWTEHVDITGASQNLVGTNGTQAITFTATTGHALNDQWSIGHLFAENCTESTTQAQVTDPAFRLLNPNVPPVWTDGGGNQLLQVDYTRGWANFSGNVGAVTVTGNNGCILESGLEKIGYLQGLTFGMTRDMVDASYNGTQAKSFLPGDLTGSGTINKLMIANKDLFDAVINTQKYFLIQLFSWDKDQDQTGDHYNIWVSFSSLGVNAPNTDTVKSNLNFTAQGMFSFVVDV